MKICILGVTGMLGHMLFSELLVRRFDVYGTARKWSGMGDFDGRIVSDVDVMDFQSVENTLDLLQPNVVINAVGLIRQQADGRESLPCIKINAEFPHLLWQACKKRDIRCIHYSTDCVFDGKAGRPYIEEDYPTAHDVYGLTKYLGEIAGPLALTIRTSIIGPELRSKLSLLEWFLAQEGVVKGYTGAIYTGLPTSEHAKILAEVILPNFDLEGLYQVSSTPISKYELLRLIAHVYNKEIEIVPDSLVQEDKRLSCAKFEAQSGYKVRSWPEMIEDMHTVHMRLRDQWRGIQE